MCIVLTTYGVWHNPKKRLIGNPARCGLRWLQYPDQLHKILMGCSKCEVISDMNISTEFLKGYPHCSKCVQIQYLNTTSGIFQGFPPLISLCSLDLYNSLVVPINNQPFYFLSEDCHLLKITTIILHGVYLLSSLCPLGWHNSPLVPITQSTFSVCWLPPY